MKSDILKMGIAVSTFYISAYKRPSVNGFRNGRGETGVWVRVIKAV